MGHCAAPRGRRRCLVALTLRALREGVASRRLLAKIVSTWIIYLLHRRPLLAIFDSVFQLGSDSYDEVIVLPRAVRTELALVSVLGLVAVTDLRAPVLNEVAAVHI